MSGPTGPGEAGPSPAQPPGDGSEAGERYPGPMAYAGIGMLNAVCLLAGGGLGWLADRAAGTLPLFLLAGLVAGAAAGALGTRAELRRYGR